MYFLVDCNSTAFTIVTKGHQEKMEKRLERAKVCNMPPPLDEDNKDIDNSLSATIITDVK